MPSANFFQSIPDSLEQEWLETVLKQDSVTIERIVSEGHTTPDGNWYDQDQHEWVIVLEGEAILSFENEADVRLETGDYINIPAHKKHRVKWTDKKSKTIWLAVFYD